MRVLLRKVVIDVVVDIAIAHLAFHAYRAIELVGIEVLVLAIPAADLRRREDALNEYRLIDGGIPDIPPDIALDIVGTPARQPAAVGRLATR